MRVRDLWFSEVPKKNPDGETARDSHGRVVYEKKKSARHPDNGGSKDAKRWLACWINPDRKEETRAFATKEDAKSYALKMEGDASRGEYIDRKAAGQKFGPLAEKYLKLRRKRDGKKPGQGTRIRTMSVYRNHVEPTFAHRLVQAVRASEIAGWLDGPLSDMSGGVRETAFHIVAGTFDLAVDDKIRRDNPARAKSVTAPHADHVQRKAWTVDRAWLVRDSVPEEYRALLDCGTGLGARQGEMFGLSPDDFAEDDPEHGGETVTISRQVLRVGRAIVLKLPKGGKVRTVPVPRGTAAAIAAHSAKYPPAVVTLPWMEEDGRVRAPVTVPLLFTWQPRPGKRVAGQCLQAGNFMQEIWRPSLVRAGILPAPEKGRPVVGDAEEARHNGMHAPRHVYDTMLSDGGVSLAGIMEFMGHSRKSAGVTVGVYGHATPETFQAAREAVDRRLYRIRSVSSSGIVTEFRSAR